MTSLLDPRFKYVPSHSTDIRQTWQRFGFRPTEPRAAAGAEWQQPKATVRTTVTRASNEDNASIAA